MELYEYFLIHTKDRDILVGTDKNLIVRFFEEDEFESYKGASLIDFLANAIASRYGHRYSIERIEY